MPSSTTWTLRFAVMAIAAVAALAAAPGASVIASPVASSAAAGLVLNLQGGIGNGTLSACRIRHHYTFYPKGHRIPFNGTLSPAPGKHFLIKVKVKACSHGRFRTVGRLTVHVKGNPTTGHYDGTVGAPRGGAFFARAYYYGTPAGSRAVARSDKQYFRVR